MADKWEQFAEPATTDKWDQFAEKTASTPSFGSRALSTGVGMLKGLGHTVLGFERLGEPLMSPEMRRRSAELRTKTLEPALKPTTPSQEAGYGAEQVLEYFAPVTPEFKAAAGVGRLGKAAVGATREFLRGAAVGTAQTGSLKEGAETGAVGGVFGAAGGALSRAKGPLVKTVLNPQEKAALAAVEKEGVPLSLGQRTGEPGIQRLERGLENFPGSGARTREFFEGQQEKLAQTGKKLIRRASPTETNAYGAGTVVQQRLTQRVQRLKSYADALYDSVRSDAAANVKTVQTGTKASPILGPSGQAITSPVFTAFETPVNLQPVRDSLKPVYDDLERSLPEGRRANSPAFRAMSQVMQSDATHMNAMDFDKFLSAVKAMSRDGKSELLSSKSQGIARQVIAAGESEFKQAMRTAGPDTIDKLTKARNAVKAYYGTDELLNSLRAEPAALFKNLVSGGDVTLDTLKELRAVAPAEVKVVGRTALEGILEKGTAEGGLSRTAGMMADWQRMGPETKNLLYGPRLTFDLDNYFLAAKRLVQPEGSPTAGRIASFFPIGIASGVATYLATGDLKEAGAALVGGVATEYLVPKIAARVLFSPGGAAMATKAIGGSNRLAVRALWVSSAKAAQDVEDEQSQQPQQ
jgi:hypothetical protein